MRTTHDHSPKPTGPLASTLISAALRCGASCGDEHRPAYADVLNCDLHGADAQLCLTFLLNTAKGRNLLMVHAAGGDAGTVVDGLRNHLTDLFRSRGIFTNHVDRWTRTARGQQVVGDDVVNRALFKSMVTAAQNGDRLMAPVGADHGIGSVGWVDAPSLRTKGSGWVGGDDNDRERVPLSGLFGYAPAWEQTPASTEMTEVGAEYLRGQAIKAAAKRNRKTPAADRRELLAALTTMTSREAWERINGMLTRLQVADPHRAAALQAQRERAGVCGSAAPELPAPLTLAETRWVRRLAKDVRHAVTSRDLADDLGGLVLSLATTRARPDRWTDLADTSDPVRHEQLLGELLNHLADQVAGSPTTGGR